MIDIHDVYPVVHPRSSASILAPSYLKSLGLPQHAVDILIDAARIHDPQEGHVLAYGSEWIHIITRGIVKETTFPGTTRLWRKGMILGDVGRVMLRRSPAASGTGPHLTFLTRGTTVSLTARTFGALIEKEPVLALLLAQLTNSRSHTVETVYALSKAGPVARVARLLDYLVQQKRVRNGSNRYRWTRKGTHLVPPEALTLSGPSQADIANALGLGRTTVEKAIASLRAEGILNALEPGTRSNRYYEIMDRNRLQSLAHSES
jgi:biotin operon repressor